MKDTRHLGVSLETFKTAFTWWYLCVRVLLLCMIIMFWEMGFNSEVFILTLQGRNQFEVIELF